VSVTPDVQRFTRDTTWKQIVHKVMIITADSGQGPPGCAIPLKPRRIGFSTPLTSTVYLRFFHSTFTPACGIEACHEEETQYTSRRVKKSQSLTIIRGSPTSGFEKELEQCEAAYFSRWEEMLEQTSWRRHPLQYSPKVWSSSDRRLPVSSPVHRFRNRWPI